MVSVNEGRLMAEDYLVEASSSMYPSPAAANMDNLDPIELDDER